MGKILTAVLPILRGNTQYLPGDTLPECADTGAWIESGAARYIDDNTSDANRQKAKMITAKPGRAGTAYPSSSPGGDLVGQVPPAEARGAAPEPRKRPGRKSAK